MGGASMPMHFPVRFKVPKLLLIGAAVATGMAADTASAETLADYELLRTRASVSPDPHGGRGDRRDRRCAL